MIRVHLGQTLSSAASLHSVSLGLDRLGSDRPPQVLAGAGSHPQHPDQPRLGITKKAGSAHQGEPKLGSGDRERDIPDRRGAIAQRWPLSRRARRRARENPSRSSVRYRQSQPEVVFELNASTVITVPVVDTDPGVDDMLAMQAPEFLDVRAPFR